jgi:DNA-directed RNA polymerase beta subunit
MLAHGASAVLLDRLFKQSDEFECYVCRHCGLIGESLGEPCAGVAPSTFCRRCRLEGPEHLARIMIPYLAPRGAPAP